MDINGKLIHFTGIGGISMSALACFAIMNGAYVTGSDLNSIPNKAYLDSIGIISYIGSNPDVACNADLLIYTSAVDTNDREVNDCIMRKIPVLARHEFLSMIAKEYRDVIAISGTHGKTTVTSMITAIFKQADYPFAAHVGGYANDISGNFYHKGNDLFVTEACEYKRSFLSLKPTLSIILNIDNDHPDTYKTREELYNAFGEFSDRANITLAYKGFNAIRAESEHIITYGFDSTCNFYASNINMYANEKYHFNIYLNEHMLIDNIHLPIPGYHNIGNAICACAAASMWGVPSDIIRKAINEYRGVSRRFEIKGRFRDSLIVSDYAHHPSEIQAVISTARKMTSGKLIVIFEPHTYSRTKALIDEFIHCFTGADKLIILPTYAARECTANGMDSNDLMERLNNLNVISAKDYCDARTLALCDIEPVDMVLVVGAGTIDRLADMLCEVTD